MTDLSHSKEPDASTSLILKPVRGSIITIHIPATQPFPCYPRISWSPMCGLSSRQFQTNILNASLITYIRDICTVLYNLDFATVAIVGGRCKSRSHAVRNILYCPLTSTLLTQVILSILSHTLAIYIFAQRKKPWKQLAKLFYVPRSSEFRASNVIPVSETNNGNNNNISICIIFVYNKWRSS
jgi:hypothetical protein